MIAAARARISAPIPTKPKTIACGITMIIRSRAEPTVGSPVGV